MNGDYKPRQRRRRDGRKRQQLLLQPLLALAPRQARPQGRRTKPIKRTSVLKMKVLFKAMRI